MTDKLQKTKQNKKKHNKKRNTRQEKDGEVERNINFCPSFSISDYVTFYIRG